MCEVVGADVKEVAAGMGYDARIGRHFLDAGLGWGGSCFPKDVSAFRSVARECGYELRLLDEVMHINEDQRQRFVRKVRTALWTLRGKHLGVLGLAFKGGTDDIRESPAIAVVKALVAEGCRVTAYDPAAMKGAAALLDGCPVEFAESAYGAMKRVDALVVLTEWSEFKSLDLKRVKELLRYPIVIDGRNLYSPEEMQKHGFIYLSMGRPDIVPQQEAEASKFRTATEPIVR
jgi:UDPglucose 6-dehydrogenase